MANENRSFAKMETISQVAKIKGLLAKHNVDFVQNFALCYDKHSYKQCNYEISWGDCLKHYLSSNVVIRKITENGEEPKFSYSFTKRPCTTEEYSINKILDFRFYLNKAPATFCYGFAIGFEADVIIKEDKEKAIIDNLKQLNAIDEPEQEQAIIAGIAAGGIYSRNTFYKNHQDRKELCINEYSYKEGKKIIKFDEETINENLKDWQGFCGGYPLIQIILDFRRKNSYYKDKFDKIDLHKGYNETEFKDKFDKIDLHKGYNETEFNDIHVDINVMGEEIL